MMPDRSHARVRAEARDPPSLTRRPPGGSTWLVGSRLDELARATPATRDRYVDFLRAASIVAVVFGHWFISINHLERDIYSTTSAVGLTSGMWLGTWLFQVMPVFFFVGGFSNLVTYDAFQRRGEPTSAFVRSRLERLLRPSLVFLGFWLIVQVALHVFDVGGAAGPRLVGETRLLRGMYPPAATLPFGPLWFLGFYIVVVCIAPATIWLHRRFRWWVPALMAARSDRRRRRRLRRRSPRAPLPERGVRAAPPASARALLRGRHVEPAAAEGVLGDGGRRARRPPPADDVVGVPGVRTGEFRLVRRDRALPEEPARHRCRVRVERLPAHGLLPAGGYLVDRGRDAAPPDAHPLARTPASLESDDLPERRDHDAVPVAHDRVLHRRCWPCGRSA